MAYNYTTCNRDQQYLLARSMKEWLGEDQFVWFLLDALVLRSEATSQSSKSEWAVICATHNLLKLFRSAKAVWN